MKFDRLNKILKLNSMDQSDSSSRVIINLDNINQWPKFEKLFHDGKIKSDSKGRLRYLHGAPVGDLILIRINKDGTKIYKESAEEWFDPESPKGKEFIWP